jgi:large subunit ribosomal protein L22
MGKPANESRTKPNESRAYGKYLRTSPQKLNLIAQTIRGKLAGRALIDLEFSPRRIAKDVRKLLQSAVANAENNHGLDVDRLIVAEATVGKTLVMKRFHARARGRSAGIEKPFSNMTIILREGGAEKADKKPKAAKAEGESKPKKQGEKKSQPKKAAAKKSEKSQGAEE